MASWFLRFLDHTQRRTTFARTPLDEWSVRHRYHYLITHNNHNRQPSISAAADLRLKPRGYWDRQQNATTQVNLLFLVSSTCFRPITRSTWLYLQYLVVFTQFAAGWCHGCVENAKQFRAMFSPIIRSTWLYLKHLVVFIQVAAGWCHGWVENAKQFRAMFSPIIRSTWLYLQHLVVFIKVAAGWCHGWVETEVCCLRGVHFNSSMTPAGSNLGEYYQML
jgi:hypothetical protein